MVRRFLLLLLALCIVIGGCTTQQTAPPKPEAPKPEAPKAAPKPVSPYSDLPIDSWAYRNIEILDKAGVKMAASQTSFGVNDKVKRADFVKLLAQVKKLESAPPATPSFKDVAADHAAFKQVEAAVKAGVLVPGGEFKPDDPVKRMDVGAWSVKALGRAKEAEAFKEPMIAALDEDAIPKDYIGLLTVAYRPEVQVLKFRRGRYVDASEPATKLEVAYALSMIVSPPVKGGVLRRAIDQDPLQLNRMLTIASGSVLVCNYMGDTLIGAAKDEKGQTIYFPKMLKRMPTQQNGLWKMLANGKMEVTYELRKGMKWHDGTEVTADDAVFMWKVTMDPKMPIVSRDGYDLIEKMTVKDKYTFVATWKQPYMYPTARTFFTLPKHVFEQGYEAARKSGKYEDFVQQMAKTPVLCGPFKFKELKSGSYTSLAANKDYYLGGPLVDELIIPTIKDSSIMYASLLKGDIDFGALTTDVGLKLEGQKPANVGLEFQDALSVLFISPNLRNPQNIKEPNPFFADKRVRQALFYSMDRKTMNATIYGGKAKVSNAWITSPLHPLYNDGVKAYNYDPAKAAQLLAEAGWKKGADGILEKDGVKFKITMVAPSGNKAYEMIEQVMQAEWKKLGIEMSINNTPWAAYAKDYRPYGNFDIILNGWGLNEFVMPSDRYVTSAIPTAENT
ncbi:MAG: ABC transporter substrate-binding protein [Bacillota bacterium]|nr:ABC transporter substrate-binding protein [Bacillota bacterium]